jgi:hypothetical protein
LDPWKDYPGSTFCAPDPKIYLPFRPRDPDNPWEKIDKKPQRYFGPDPIIPPVKCSRYFDPDNPDGPPYVLYEGPDKIIPPVRCGPFVPIPPVKCVPTGGGPIGDPPIHPPPDYPIW